MSEEKKQPEVVETSTMAVLDPRDASNTGVALMRERVDNQKKMLAIAIQLTSPSQWVVFAGDGRESIYPTGGASDTILRRAFGLTWANKRMEVEETPDGRLATFTADLMQGDRFIEEYTGYRFMGGFVKNEASLRKGAIENCKSVAVRDLLGLRFRTPAELKEMGLDVAKLERRAEFQSHEKDPGTIKVPFGRDAGKPITDVDDDALKWLAEAVKKSIADKDKAKWKSKNEAMYQALRAEYVRRHPPQELGKQPATNAAPPNEEPPHDPDTGEVNEEAPQLCAQPGCDSPATHGVYCGGHLPSQKGQGELDMRQPGEEG